jgi:hypothetical protein
MGNRWNSWDDSRAGGKTVSLGPTTPQGRCICCALSVPMVAGWDHFRKRRNYPNEITCQKDEEEYDIGLPQTYPFEVYAFFEKSGRDNQQGRPLKMVNQEHGPSHKALQEKN